MAGIFAASVRNLKEKVEDTVIQTRMNTSQQDKMQIWIKSIDVSNTYKLESHWLMPICSPSYFSSLLWSWSTSSSHLFHPDHCDWLAGNFNPEFMFGNKEQQAKGETTVPDPHASKPAKVLRIPLYALSSICITSIISPRSYFPVQSPRSPWSYFPVSLSSWRTSCDVNLVGGPSNIII